MRDRLSGWAKYETRLKLPRNRRVSLMVNVPKRLLFVSRACGQPLTDIK